MNYEETKTESAGAGRSFFSRSRAGLLCALLLTLMAAQMLAVVRQKSLTVDEPLLIAAGYYHLTAGDFRPVNEHPPVAKVLGALPLLFTGTQAPAIDPRPQANYEYFLNLFRELWKANEARYEELTFRARVPMVALTILLGVLIYFVARRMWGTRAALFAVALYSLEPTVLAHGRVVQTDIPSAFAYFLFAFALYEYLRRPSLVRAALAGLAAGFAVVTKFSMVVLAPVLCVVFVALLIFAARWGLKRGHVAAQAVALALAAVFAVNAAYFFRQREPEPYNLSLARLGLPAALDESLSGPLSFGHLALQKIFPVDFVSGIDWQLAHNRDGHPAGLLGQHRQHGWWYYFPVAFALKTTLPFLLVSLAAIFWAAWVLGRRGFAAEGRLLFLLVPLAVFTGFVLLSKINIGVRYFLPAFPFLFIAAGVLLDRLLKESVPRRRAAVVALVVILFGWVGLEAARAYPDHMSYTNQLASGQPRWYYLSDSNVEWGDDIRALALYLHERGERRIGAALLNWQVLELYGIEQASVFVPPGVAPEETRYVALGASVLNGSTVPGQIGDVKLTEEQRVNYFDQYRRRTPEKVFGNSIYLYRMKE
ncbi:MAG TPA: glycosyltransferase family 39 protein [Pyrinomonadaceae bacterium]|nr:glycosyltransferase family 39 protein [Pyrinomonadaceae bacterium]